MSEAIRVTVSVRSLALLSIFYDLDAHSDEPVALAQLQELWRPTGLRESDLLLGLQELAAVGQIQLSSEGTHYQIFLTEAGASRSQNLHQQVQHSGSELQALTVLLQTSRRHRSSRPGFGRRQVDGQSRAIGLPCH